MFKTVAFTCVSLLVVVTGCESKEDKINKVCDKLHAEDMAKCAGDKACTSEADAKRDACRGLAKTVAESEGRPSMADQVNDVQSKCDKGDLEACTTYGAALMLGKGVTKDEAKGFALVTKACDGGKAEGCEMVGRAYERGMGVPADKAQKAAYMTKACTLGSGGGCRSYAMGFEHTDPKRIEPLQKACELKDALGCMGLGAAYMHGNQGAPKDTAKAKKYLQAACDLDPGKLANACDTAKTL